MSNLAINPATGYIATDETTNSTSYTDLATVGPAATITVGASGKALVLFGAGLYTNATLKKMSVAVSGATTIAASDNYMIRRDGAAFDGTQMRAHLFTGLTPGSTTFTAKYAVASGTCNFFARFLIAVPL